MGSGQFAGKAIYHSEVWGLEIQDQGTGGLGVLWGPTSSFTSTTFLPEHHMVDGQLSIFVLIL